MTQQVYRGNLAAAKFPFISEGQGRTIIVPAYDNTYVPVVASKTDDDKDRGIPQIYYCHNVMPASEGWQAVGYDTKVEGIEQGFATKSVFNIRSNEFGKAKLHHRTDGTNWIYLGANWIQINSVSSYIATITVAHIQGDTYFYFANTGCYRYNFTTMMLEPVTLAGLDLTKVIGILAASGYLIAWSQDVIAWCSTTDITDFVPSLVSGAGGGSVENARGRITVCAPHALGFIVYTEENAVAVVYSGNARFPFSFKEITGSGGCSSLDLISWDSNTNNHYAYTSSGLQTIALNGAAVYLPELTDFLAGKYFETFNETTREFESTTFTGVLLKRLSVVSDRYLVISYGLPTTTQFSHAIVYDLITRRFGKFKVTHVQIFEWNYYAPELSEAPRECIGVLGRNGEVRIVNLSQNNPNAFGVMIVGKFQWQRSRMMTIQEAHVENITVGGTFNLYDMWSLDGKNFTIDAGYLLYSSGKFRKYGFSQPALNHSQLWIGAFNASSFVLHLSAHGKSNFFG